MQVLAVIVILIRANSNLRIFPWTKSLAPAPPTRQSDFHRDTVFCLKVSQGCWALFLPSCPPPWCSLPGSPGWWDLPMARGSALGLLHPYNPRAWSNGWMHLFLGKDVEPHPSWSPSTLSSWEGVRLLCFFFFVNKQLPPGIHLPDFFFANHSMETTLENQRELSSWVVKGDLLSDRKITFFIQPIIRSRRKKLNEGKILFL